MNMLLKILAANYNTIYLFRYKSRTFEVQIEFYNFLQPIIFSFDDTWKEVWAEWLKAKCLNNNLWWKLNKLYPLGKLRPSDRNKRPSTVKYYYIIIM